MQNLNSGIKTIGYADPELFNSDEEYYCLQKFRLVREEDPPTKHQFCTRLLVENEKQAVGFVYEDLPIIRIFLCFRERTSTYGKC